MRIYNPALGRFLSEDPVLAMYPMLTPYQFASNSPIIGIDLDGMEFFNSMQTHAAFFSKTMVDVANEYTVMKLVHPTWNDTKLFALAAWNVNSNRIHHTLDVAGLLPVAGEIPDLINGGIYMLEGNKMDATLSFAAMIPVAGVGATVGKWGKNALRFAGEGFRSASGLMFKLGSKHGNRLSHVLEHTVDDVKKSFHGVFDVGDNLINTLDDAWSTITSKGWSSNLKAGQSEVIDGVTRTMEEFTLKDGSKQLRESFVVDMGKKIGYEGGKKGSKDALQKVNIVVEANTSNVITAFPTK